jgi:hypothetical protein
MRLVITSADRQDPSDIMTNVQFSMLNVQLFQAIVIPIYDSFILSIENRTLTIENLKKETQPGSYSISRTPPPTQPPAYPYA